MTPYGIVYRDNPYALQKSVEIWQKKFGVFNISAFLKIGGISAVILLAVNLILGLFTEVVCPAERLLRCEPGQRDEERDVQATGQDRRVCGC